MPGETGFFDSMAVGSLQGRHGVPAAGRARAGRRPLAWLLAASLLLGCTPEDGQPVDERPADDDLEAADLILTNGEVFTLNPEQPWGQALAVGGGRILAVGTTAEIIGRYRGEVTDLNGAMVLPGFHDVHVHPLLGGIQILQCDLSGAATVEETLALVAACHEANPDGDGRDDDWLVGRGWNLGLFADANPHKRLLDDIIDDRPVYLEAADGHSGWVNSRALARAGITADTEDPPLGAIERNAEGEPTGTLRENAQELVLELIPEITAEQRLEAAVLGLEQANAFGITSMVVGWVSAGDLEIWRRLAADDRLTARLVTSVLAAGGSSGEFAHLADPTTRGSDALLRTHSAKIFLDGVLEGETAALLEPYLDVQGKGAGRTGTLNVPWERLQALVTDLDARGIQVHMHAIGDRAVGQGLDALEAARDANGDQDNRHHIAHLQLVHADDVPRFAELDVLANFQALWAYPDAYITDVNLPAVGQARVERMYPIGSIEDAGATIVGGSDWPVSSINPLDAIETAVTRQDPDGQVAGVLNPDEAVSLQTMLAAYTRNGAYLMHQEDRTGSLEPGKLADLVVLEANLFELEPAQINETRVLRTYLAGRQVHPRTGPAGSR